MRQDVKGQGNGLIWGNSIIKLFTWKEFGTRRKPPHDIHYPDQSSMPDLQNTKQDYCPLERSENIKFLKLHEM